MEFGCLAVTLRGIKSSDSRPDDIVVKIAKVLEGTNRANMVL